MKKQNKFITISTIEKNNKKMQFCYQFVTRYVSK